MTFSRRSPYRARVVTRDDRTGNIVLEQVTQRFLLPRENREFTAVQDVSFEIGGGEFVSIVGPSGCGKSTLLSLIAGLVPVTAGRISLDGQPVDGVNPRLGFVFQRDALLPGRPSPRTSASRSCSAASMPRRPARASPSGSRGSVSPASRAITRISCPAACESAWPWP